MKRVIVIAKYEAYVSDDLDISQIEDLSKEEVKEYFQLYDDKTDTDIIFDLNDVGD
jgi:hypothetical protein